MMKNELSIEVAGGKGTITMILSKNPMKASLQRRLYKQMITNIPQWFSAAETQICWDVMGVVPTDILRGDLEMMKEEMTRYFFYKIMDNSGSIIDISRVESEMKKFHVALEILEGRIKADTIVSDVSSFDTPEFLVRIKRGMNICTDIKNFIKAYEPCYELRNVNWHIDQLYGDLTQSAIGMLKVHSVLVK